MLRARPGWRRIRPSRSRVNTICEPKVGNVPGFTGRTSKARSGWTIFWRRGARVALEIGTKTDDRYLKSTPVRSNGASFEEMNQVELAPPARSDARTVRGRNG